MKLDPKFRLELWDAIRDWVRYELDVDEWLSSCESYLVQSIIPFQDRIEDVVAQEIRRQRLDAIDNCIDDCHH